MQELEKILEEIDQTINRYGENPELITEDITDFCYGLNVAKGIIRKHMNDGERFEFDFSNVKSFDCQCGRHYVNTGAENNDGWIPVEKDLPKNESEVWVVLESTYGTGYRTYSSARYLYFENYGEGHWCDEHYGYLEWDKYSDGRGGSSQYKVIAWQSIAPYRPERSEGE